MVRWGKESQIHGVCGVVESHLLSTDSRKYTHGHCARFLNIRILRSLFQRGSGLWHDTYGGIGDGLGAMGWLLCGAASRESLGCEFRGDAAAVLNADPP